VKLIRRLHKAKLSTCLLLLALTIFSAITVPEVVAQVDTFKFETDEQEARFRTLSNELRCPMCQNTSLTGSTGGVAQDLRREIHRMILEGMSNAEIEQFMFERYGDFIFYRPRLTTNTLLLWFGPLIFLLIGAFLGFGIWRRAKQVNIADVELDPEQQQRLKDLLGNKQ